jgi:hypothetical protein
MENMARRSLFFVFLTSQPEIYYINNSCYITHPSVYLGNTQARCICTSHIMTILKIIGGRVSQALDIICIRMELKPIAR